jgi:predicted O-methyltransferase YrrM
MIPNPEAYFRQMVPVRDALLTSLEEEAVQEQIPIVGPVVGELLFVLARAVQARQILELGTATGYSAIYLAKGCEPFEGQVVTLERDDGMARRASANFVKAGLEHRIEVVVGDAFEAMTKMRGSFDLVFLDIDKESYAKALSFCESLLRPGGLLIADNVAFRGADAFNRVVSAHPGWKAVHLLALLPQHSPEKDGLCLAVKV